MLNYPIAHHRYHRALQREEHERDPELAVTWPTLAEWPAAYERQIDAEIEMADCILVGSTYVRDTFVSEGDPVQDFTLQDQDRKDWKLSDAARKGDVVLAFFPFAFTGTCGTPARVAASAIAAASARSFLFVFT